MSHQSTRQSMLTPTIWSNSLDMVHTLQHHKSTSTKNMHESCATSRPSKAFRCEQQMHTQALNLTSLAHGASTTLSECTVNMYTSCATSRPDKASHCEQQKHTHTKCAEIQIPPDLNHLEQCAAHGMYSKALQEHTEQQMHTTQNTHEF